MLSLLKKKYEILINNPQYCTFHHNKKFIKDFSPFHDWGEKQINERAKKLAEEAYTSIWRFNPPISLLNTSTNCYWQGNDEI